MLGALGAATAASRAVPLAEFSKALSKLVPNVFRSQVGVAVSGGSDSMALCTLLAQHRQKEGWPENVISYTIDHGVRIGCTAEAKQVAKKMKDLGFKPRILTISQDLRKEFEREVPGNLEAVLRTERFNLIFNAAKEDKVHRILQGHHQDDQYETVLQRLAWGSTLAGLGGIPALNGVFCRPLLVFSKASLRATCEENNVAWFEDPTNAVTTYAMRNAIRSMIDNQEDLPIALRRENILAVQRRGDAFRTELCKRIDSTIRLCRFSIELFNKILKVQVPQDLYEVPERVLRHFIPALIRIWREETIQHFQFNGTAEDTTSIRLMKTFYKLGERNNGRFNVQGVDIIKKRCPRLGWFELYIKPEIPRHALRKHEIELKPIQSEDRVWKDYYFEFPAEWPQMHKIKVTARGNTNFYFRHWEEGKKGDTRIIQAIKRELRPAERKRWENFNTRVQDYPACLYAVLCHREKSVNYPKKKVEWIDAVPQFGININPNVRTSTDGIYDLGTPGPEWRELSGVTDFFQGVMPSYVNQGVSGKTRGKRMQVTKDGRATRIGGRGVFASEELKEAIEKRRRRSLGL